MTRADSRARYPSGRFLYGHQYLRVEKEDQDTEMGDMPGDPKSSVGVVQEEDPDAMHVGSSSRGAAHERDVEGEQGDGAANGGARSSWFHRRTRSSQPQNQQFKVYKRRWWGLLQLALLNIVVSWDWLTFAPVSATAAEYYGVSETTINWLSTAFQFSFVFAAPLTVWMLHRGPKQSMLVSSALIFVGNWVRYAGTRGGGGMFGVVMFGQILTGLAQPFVLAAPTRYSDLWFTESGRIAATAFVSLANPFGAGLAQLINPSFGSIPSTVLYVSIIATVATIPTFFLPSTPPTPPSASSALSKTPVSTSLKLVFRSRIFYVLFITIGCYIALFNAFSTLLNQILYPYSFTEDQAGICGAVLIVVGLVSAAITSPIFDRTHAYLLGIKIFCPVLALSYLAFVWAPQTRTVVAPYVLAALLGAMSFSLLPIALEYLVEVTYPASPEVSSTLVWSMSQLFGGVFIVIMNALKDGEAVYEAVVSGGGNGGDRPEGNMYRALVFQAVIALVVLPLPLCLGVKRLGLAHEEGRLHIDEAGEREVEDGVHGRQAEQDI